MGYGDNLTYGKKLDNLRKVYIGTGRSNGKTAYESLVENCRYGLDYSHDDHSADTISYWYNDCIRTMEAYKNINKNQIKNVIFNNPATIVFWGDGSKTVVKCNEDEFDPEKGLAMAIAKHFMGTSKSKGDYYKVFEEWVPKEEEVIERKPIGQVTNTTVNEEDNSITLDCTLYFTPEDGGKAWKGIIETIEGAKSNATDNGGN